MYFLFTFTFENLHKHPRVEKPRSLSTRNVLCIGHYNIISYRMILEQQISSIVLVRECTLYHSVGLAVCLATIKTSQAALSLKGLKEVRWVIDYDVGTHYYITYILNTPSANSNNDLMAKNRKRKSEFLRWNFRRNSWLYNVHTQYTILGRRPKLYYRYFILFNIIIYNSFKRIFDLW